ncbi:MAG: hypothetical protein RR957_03290 [Oscillospiraceae bacterium]
MPYKRRLYWILMLLPVIITLAISVLLLLLDNINDPPGVYTIVNIQTELYTKSIFLVLFIPIYLIVINLIYYPPNQWCIFGAYIVIVVLGFLVTLIRSYGVSVEKDELSKTVFIFISALSFIISTVGWFGSVLTRTLIRKTREKRWRKP